MNDATIIDFAGQDIITDPLTDLLRKGARELLQAAVEAERDAFLAEFCREAHAGRARGGCSQRASSGARRADRDRAGHGESAEGAGKGRQARGVPLGACAALCPESEVHRGRASLAVFEGHLHRGNGRGSEDAPRSGGSRLLRQDNLTAEMPVGRGVQ